MTKLSAVLFPSVCLLLLLLGAEAVLVSQTSELSAADHASSHEIEERQVDKIESLSSHGIALQCCHSNRWSDCCINITEYLEKTQNCLNPIVNDRYKDPDAPKNKKCKLRLAEKKDARDVFVHTLGLIYRDYVSKPMKEIEKIASVIEDPLKDKYDDKTILTPQQMKRALQKWESQFLDDKKFNCCHPFTTSTFQAGSTSLSQDGYTNIWTKSLSDITFAMEVVESYKKLGNTSGKKSTCLRGCVGEKELFCVLEAWGKYHPPILSTTALPTTTLPTTALRTTALRTTALPTTALPTTLP